MRANVVCQLNGNTGASQRPILLMDCRKIFIWGCHGRRNIGDDAICISLTETLGKMFNYKTKIYVYTKENYIEKGFSKVEGLQIHFVSSIPRILKAFIISKIIIIDGGDHIHDYGAIFKRLKVLMAFFLFAIATKATFKKLLIINGGFRATTPVGLTLLRMILSLVSCVSARDKDAYTLISKYASERSQRGFDTSILSDYNFKRNTTGFLCTYPNEDVAKKKVGISVSPIFSNFFADSEKDDLLVQVISRDLKELLYALRNVDFYFLAFNTKPKGEDLGMIKKIVQTVDPELKKRVKLIAYNGNIYDFMSELSHLDVIVCCKYHSVVFSYLLQKPMIVINYHPKNAALVYEIGLSSKALLSLGDVFNGKLGWMLLEVLKNSKQFMARLPIHEAKRRALSGIEKCVLCGIE